LLKCPKPCLHESGKYSHLNSFSMEL
jgi:hypothetical protein